MTDCELNASIQLHFFTSLVTCLNRIIATVSVNAAILVTASSMIIATEYHNPPAHIPFHRKRKTSTVTRSAYQLLYDARFSERVPRRAPISRF